MTHRNSPPVNGCSILMYAISFELVCENSKSGLNLGENKTMESVQTASC